MRKIWLWLKDRFYCGRGHCLGQIDFDSKRGPTWTCDKCKRVF